MSECAGRSLAHSSGQRCIAKPALEAFRHGEGSSRNCPLGRLLWSHGHGSPTRLDSERTWYRESRNARRHPSRYARTSMVVMLMRARCPRRTSRPSGAITLMQTSGTVSQRRRRDADFDETRPSRRKQKGVRPQDMSAPKVEMDTQDTQLMSMEKRRGRGGSSGDRDRGRDATRPCCYVTRRRDASRSDRGRTLSSAFTSPRDAIWDTLPFGVTRAFVAGQGIFCCMYAAMPSPQEALGSRHDSGMCCLRRMRARTTPVLASVGG